MKTTNYLTWKRTNRALFRLLIALNSCVFSFNLSAQIVYANSVLTDGTVINANNSTDQNEGTGAILEASAGVLLGVGATPANISLSFPADVPANTTTFLKIQTQDDILSSLLGGTLGDLLSTTVGVALTGNQEFTVEAKNSGGTNVLTANSSNPSTFAGERMKIVRDASNNTYLAITPNVAYRTIKITNETGALLGLGVKKTMTVYDAFYYSTPQLCAKPKFTSYDGQGISLELLNLGGGVTNLNQAIDLSLNTYSTLSLGVVSVTSSLVQRAYFEGPSLPGDQFAIRISLDPELLSINLGQFGSVIAQLGGNVVSTATLQSFLTPTMVTQILNGQPVDLIFTPNSPVDRISLQISGLLGVALSQSIQIHEFYKITAPPILDVTSIGQTICEGTSTALTATASSTANEIRWYSTMTGATPIAVTASGGNFSTGPLFNDTIFYVSSGIIGCPDESIRIPVQIDVISGPDPTPLAPINPVSHCAVDTAYFNFNGLFNGPVNYYSSQSATTPISNGEVIGGQTYFLQNGNLAVIGLTTANSPFSIYVGVEDTITGCITVPGDYYQYTISIIDEPTATTSSTQQSFCLSTNPTVADLATNEPSVNWYDAPVNGLLLSSTTPLTTATSYYAATVGAVCEASVRLEIEVTINDEPAPTTTDATQYFCLSDNATIADLIVSAGSLNWYDENNTLLTQTSSLSHDSYYFATTQGAICESADSLMIFVQISDLPAPNGDSIQVFCSYNNPTIEDLSTVESQIIWQDAAGTIIPPNTPLIDGEIYYAVLFSPNCTSFERLEVTVEFENVAAPVLSDTIQTFCESDFATIADLDSNGLSLNWYDAQIGGNLLASNTPLTDGMTYYAAQLGAYCESTVRIALNVIIESIPAPTTSASNQVFCTNSLPTVADISVNESNVVWYDEGGNQLSSSDPLASGTYYGKLDNGNCQSMDSLVVTIVLGDSVAAQLNGQFQDVCLMDTSNYYAPPGMLNYTWTVVGGTIISGGTTNDNVVSISWNATTGASIQVSYETPDGCLVSMPNEMQVSLIHCSDLTITKTASNLTPFIGEQIQFTISVVNNGTDVFNNVIVEEIIQSGFGFVSYEATHGVYNSATGEWLIPVLGSQEVAVLKIFVTVNASGSYKNLAVITSTGALSDFDTSNNNVEIEVEPGCFTVYNEMSPNGDGINDVLVIDCIEYYPNNSISIFNRYGNIIYSTTGYQNDWNGVANVKGVVGQGEPLPQGTYFYTLKVEEASVETSGWIYIVR